MAQSKKAGRWHSDIVFPAATKSETPLDHMLHVMRYGTQDNAQRDEMAKIEAPYDVFIPRPPQPLLRVRQQQQ